jgi:hypothetical protein
MQGDWSHSSAPQSRRTTMRALSLALSCGIFALISVSAPQSAQAQEKTAKNCRLEQQCHWENFKKICVWVKVCR